MEAIEYSLQQMDRTSRIKCGDVDQYHTRGLINEM